MAAASYWTIFTLTLFLTTLEYSKWSNFWEKSCVKVHVSALILPFLQTSVILTQKPISSEGVFPIMCKVKYDFNLAWLLPLSFYYTLSFAFGLTAAIRFWRIHSKKSFRAAICSFSGNSSSPGSTNPLVNQHPANFQTNTSGSDNSNNTPSASFSSPSFSQRKYAEKFSSCILRLSIYSIGYITFSGLYLFSIAGHGSTLNSTLNSSQDSSFSSTTRRSSNSVSPELSVFLALVDSICVLILVLLSGIWTASNGGSKDEKNKICIGAPIPDFNEPLMFSSAKYQPPAPGQIGNQTGNIYIPVSKPGQNMMMGGPNSMANQSNFHNNNEQPTHLLQQQNQISQNFQHQQQIVNNMPLAHNHPHPAFHHQQNQPQI